MSLVFEAATAQLQALLLCTLGAPAPRMHSLRLVSQPCRAPWPADSIYREDIVFRDPSLSFHGLR